MLDYFNFDPDKTFHEPFDTAKYQRLISEGYTKDEAFLICSFNENTLINFKDYKLFFLSYRHSDRDKYPIILQMLFLLKNLWPSFLDVSDIPFDQTAAWESYVEKSISQSTLVLLFWSIEASKSKAISKEIEITLKNDAYLIVLLFDDTPIDIFPENTVFIRNLIPYNNSTQIAEELALVCLFIRTLFTPALNRRPSADRMLSLSVNPSIARMSARNISRNGNWEVIPKSISLFADFIVDMPSLSESDGSIPLTIEELIKLRETGEYGRYLNTKK